MKKKILTDRRRQRFLRSFSFRGEVVLKCRLIVTCTFFTPREIKDSCCSVRCLCVSLQPQLWWKDRDKGCPQRGGSYMFDTWTWNHTAWFVLTRPLFSSSFMTLLIDRSKNSKLPGIFASSPEPWFLALIYYSFPYRLFTFHPLTENCKLYIFSPEDLFTQSWPKLAVRKLGNGICINPTHRSFTCLWGDSWLEGGGEMHCQSTCP